MNFQRNEYNYNNNINNSFSKTNHYNFYHKKIVLNNPLEKLISSFSLSNFSAKNANNNKPLFHNTSSLFNTTMHNKNKNNNLTQVKFFRLNPKKIEIKKIKIKKSSSSIFQNNDIDLVRNLNIDSMSQFYNNMRLKKNLKSYSKDYFEKPSQIKQFLFKEKNENNKEDDIDDDFEQKNDAEKLPILNRNAINKSYEIILNNNKKLKVELDEKVEKFEINKLKILQKEEEEKKIKLAELFEKIKEIVDEIAEIEEENQFMNDLYLKSLNDISNDKNQSGVDIFDEIIKFKIKNKFFNKNKDLGNNLKKRKSILQVLRLKKKNLIENSENDDESSVENESRMGGKKTLKNRKSENFEKNLKKSNKKKKYDNFKKGQEERMIILKNKKENLENIINEIEKELTNKKKEEKEIIDRLMMSYKEMLYKGINIRSEGLVWIIRAIWDLGKNVPMSFMPEFLDCESIDYLFKLARKQNSIELLTKKIIELKMKLKKKVNNRTSYLKLPIHINESKNDDALDNDKTLTVKAKINLRMEKDSHVKEINKKKYIYKELFEQLKENENKFEIINMPEILMIEKIQKKIDKIKKEIDELKSNEMKRIYKCFIEKNYENIYHIDIGTVLGALIGEAKDTEINKYNLAKKTYVTSIKQIRFFDRKYKIN